MAKQVVGEEADQLADEERAKQKARETKRFVGEEIDQLVEAERAKQEDREAREADARRKQVRADRLADDLLSGGPGDRRVYRLLPPRTLPHSKNPAAADWSDGSQVDRVPCTTPPRCESSHRLIEIVGRDVRRRRITQLPT